MKTCFFSVVYPSVERFLPDFVRTLAAQTESDFSLVLVNDGVDDLDRFLTEFEPARLNVLTPGRTPQENRRIGIRHALKEGAAYLVFGDSDDFFSVNRVETCIETLDAGWDIVVNNLTTVDAQGEVLASGLLSKRIGDGQEIRLQDVLGKNLLGLSNTAVRVESLNELDLPGDLVALDWYLFSVLLLQRRRAVFEAQAETFYRQHGANTVGMGGVTVVNVVRLLEAKTQHYRAMSCLSGEYQDGALYEQTLEFVKRRPEVVPEYVDYLVQRMYPYPLWWETILPWKKAYEVPNNN